MEANQALKKLLVNDVILPLIIMNGQKCCTLHEVEAHYSLTLRGLPGDALIIKCDRFPTTKDVFFKSENRECKRADYILISDSKRIVMFFELKHSIKSAKPKDIIAQLKGAKCIVDYCESIISAFLGEHCIFRGYENRYYKGITKAPKKRSFEKLEIMNNIPESAKVLSGDYAYFGWLLE